MRICFVSCPPVLAVFRATPFASVKDLLAPRRAHLGACNFSLSRTGSTLHLKGTLSRMLPRIDFVHFSRKGISVTMCDLMAGQAYPALHHTTAAQPRGEACGLKQLALRADKRFALPHDL